MAFAVLQLADGFDMRRPRPCNKNSVAKNSKLSNSKLHHVQPSLSLRGVVLLFGYRFCVVNSVNSNSFLSRSVARPAAPQRAARMPNGLLQRDGPASKGEGAGAAAAVNKV